MAKPFLESLGACRDRGPARTHRVLVARRLAEHGLTPRARRPGSTRPRRRRPAGQGLRAGRRDQPRRDGRPAPGRHRRPVAQPRRGAEGDRRRSSSPTAAPTWRPASRRSTRCSSVSTIPQKEVVFLTDLQAASWRARPDDEGLKRVHRADRGAAAAVGRDRPGKGGRRKPGGHRPEARRARRHRRIQRR